jgi:YVTN family beta-propeller protein
MFLRSAALLGALGALASIYAATPPTYAVLKSYPVPGEGGWDYMKVDPGSHRLFISRGTRVQVMDTGSGRMVGEIANTPGVHGIALDTRLGKGFTSNGRENTVTVFDLRTLRELARVKTGTNPDGIVYDPSAERIFTFNGRSGDSTAIDARTNKVVGTIKLDGKPEFPAADGKGHVFVNIEDKGEIQEIDSHTLSVLKTWPLAPGESPSGLAIDPRRNLLFSACDNHMMAVSDGNTGKVVATPAIGDGPDAAGFDPRFHLAFTSNGEGTLSIVQEGTYAVVQTLKTQPSARTMALDPRNHMIYLIAARRAGSSDPSSHRLQVIPGTTVILVVGPKS